MLGASADRVSKDAPRSTPSDLSSSLLTPLPPTHSLQRLSDANRTSLVLPSVGCLAVRNHVVDYVPNIPLFNRQHNLAVARVLSKKL